MHIKITFDKSSSLWEKDFEFNKLFTKSKVLYIMDCYRTYGYIYLSKIYELFGLKWNPYNDNTYWVWERDGELEISIIMTRNSEKEFISTYYTIPDKRLSR